jgi:hypothetical protein
MERRHNVGHRSLIVLDLIPDLGSPTYEERWEFLELLLPLERMSLGEGTMPEDSVLLALRLPQRKTRRCNPCCNAEECQQTSRQTTDGCTPLKLGLFLVFLDMQLFRSAFGRCSSVRW